MAIAALQGLLEKASLAATERCAAALATDAAALADLSDWDEPPPRVQDGAFLEPSGSCCLYLHRIRIATGVT